MIEKSCHSCEYGVYENQEESIRAITLTCRTEANYDGEVVDPKRYVCNLWRERIKGNFSTI
jgi:hypothetical protein